MDFNFDTSTISTILELDPGTSNLTVAGPAGVIIPKGSIGQRVQADGVIRFNTNYSIGGSNGVFEGFDGIKWGNVLLASTGNLTSLDSLNSTGFVVQTGAGTFAERVITVTAGQLTVSNGSGVSGNVVLGLANAGSAGTYVSVSTDAFGRVTSGNATQTWSTITNTPTTLAGYAISDAVLNAGGAGAISEAAFGSRPAAATAGNLFIATDTLALYRDTGATWNLVFPALTGEVTSTAGSLTTALSTTGVSAGTYGGTSEIPVFTVDSKGRITSAANIAMASSSISVTGSDLTMSGSTGTAITNATLATVNGNVGTFGSNNQVATFTVDAKGRTTSAGNVSITPASIGAVSTGVVGQPNGVATLDNNGTLTVAQIPGALVGALQYNGTWNATTGNTTSLSYPTIGWGIAPAPQGQYFLVTTAGTTTVGTTVGNVNQWDVGDIVVSDGVYWDKMDGTSTEVNSVVGKVGAVTLTLASVDFTSQGTATTVLHGNATGAPSWGAISLSSDVTGTLPTTSFPALNGDVTTLSGNITTTLASTGVSAGMYGSSTAVSQITVDAKGRVLTAANVTIPNSLTFTGNVTGSGSVGGSTALTLENIGTAGTYGSATAVPVITTDAKGRVTGVTTSSISSSISATGADFTFSGTTGTAITNGTLATVNGNVGQFGGAGSVIPVITVNAKGLVTAVGTSTVTPLSIGAVQNIAGTAPSIQEGVFGSLPAAGTAGRIYIATDTKAIYRDNGASWDQIGAEMLLYAENASTPAAQTVTGANALALGSGNKATATYSLASGFGANALVYGGEVRANGSFSVAGDAQTGKYVLRNVTTVSATPVELFADGAGATARIALSNNSAVAYTALIVAHNVTTAGNDGAWKIEGLIKRGANAGSVALVGNRSKTTLTRPNANWDVEVYAANGSLTFQAQTNTNDTVRWVCTVTTSEVTS